MNINLLVVSDSHGNVAALRGLLKMYAPYVGAVVHLGDVAADLLRLVPEFPALEVHAVTGNCDSSSKQEEIFTVNGCKILITHGHSQEVKAGYDRIAYYAEEKEVNACFFGHTHRPEAFVRGPIYFFNPGSLGHPPPGLKPSYGLVKISDEGVVNGKVMELI